MTSRQIGRPTAAGASPGRARLLRVRKPAEVGAVVLPTLLVCVVLLAAIPRSPKGMVTCGSGITWYPGGQTDQTRSVLVLSSDASPSSLEACIDVGIRSVDLVIAGSGGATAARLVAAMGEVINIASVRAPPQHRIVGAKRLLEAVVVETDQADLLVAPVADGQRLRVALNSP